MPPASPLATTPEPSLPFRHKALAAFLAAVAGGIGLNRLYLRQRFWWLPLSITALTLPWMIGVRNWYQTPAFFVAMIPVIAGFIQAIVLALMPDEKFDTRFNARSERRNHSRWDAVLVAVLSLFVGAIVLMTTIALLNQTLIGYAPRAG